MHTMFFGPSQKSTRPDCGENIYFGRHENVDAAILSAIQDWYKSYDPKLLQKCSKYACVNNACHAYGVRNPADQIIWKCTKELGVGAAKLEDENIFFVVTRYRPAGNIFGSYSQNVMGLKNPISEHKPVKMVRRHSVW